MRDIDHFHLVNREHGVREGDPVLQAVSQLLLLHVSARVACAVADTGPDVLIAHLNARIESLQRGPQHVTRHPA